MRLQVIATPYSTSFDRTRIADEVQFKFDRCSRALGAGAGGIAPAVSASLPELPVFGVGHSLGCLVHLLICSRYAVQRAGNVFMSYNDKPLEDIPFLASSISPSARMLGPILSQVRRRGTFRTLRRMCPCSSTLSHPMRNNSRGHPRCTCKGLHPCLSNELPHDQALRCPKLPWDSIGRQQASSRPGHRRETTTLAGDVSKTTGKCGLADGTSSSAPAPILRASFITSNPYACFNSTCSAAQLAASPLSAQLMSSAELLRGMSPALVRQVLPVLDQLLPVFLDVANGTQSFTPGAEETQSQLRTYYGVHHHVTWDHSTIHELHTYQIAQMPCLHTRIRQSRHPHITKCPNSVIRSSW